MRIVELEHRDEGLAALVRAHLRFAAENTPAGLVFAQSADVLLASGARFFGASVEGELVAIAALRPVEGEDRVLEIKSMHTLAKARGRGAASALLEHLLGVAERSGATRVVLETGSTSSFRAAHALYAKFGFATCAPFGAYEASEHSRFLSVELPARGG